MMTVADVQAKDYRQVAAVEDEQGATYAALRSLLRTWIENVRGGFFELYDMKPPTMTLGQLLPLYLQHSGSRGQAFEWAVSEAINDPRRSEVRGLIGDAMARCGLEGEDPRSILFGHERLSRDMFLEDLYDTVGESARLRLFRKNGRPYNLKPLVEKLRKEGINALDGPLAAFGKADLLLSDADTPSFVAASCKHNPADVDRWAGVPVWITAQPVLGPQREPLDEDRENGRVVVTLPFDGQFMVAFERAEAILTRLAHEVLGRSAKGLGATDRLQAKMLRDLGQQIREPVLSVADDCDEMAQPGLIVVGESDMVRVPAPSWLTRIRSRLIGRPLKPVPRRLVDIARPFIFDNTAARGA